MRETASRGEERGADPRWTGSGLRSTAAPDQTHQKNHSEKIVDLDPTRQRDPYPDLTL